MELGPNQFIVEVNFEKLSVRIEDKSEYDTKSFALLNLILAQGSINLTKEQLSKIFNQ